MNAPARRAHRTRRQRTPIRLSVGRSYRRITLSRHGITLSLGPPRSGLRLVWRRGWPTLWQYATRVRDRLWEHTNETKG